MCHTGRNVCDVNGGKIGLVQAYNTQANCLAGEGKDSSLRNEVYIPARAIKRSDIDDIYVTRSHNELNDDRYVALPKDNRSTHLLVA